MNYTLIDPILNAWADSRKLHIQTIFKDMEIRSVDIIDSQGKRFQLWVDEPDKAGNTMVHIWDMKKKREDFIASKFSLKDKLENAYRCAKNWSSVEPVEKTP